MDEQLTDSAQEIKRLRRCISEVVSLLALPAVWSGREPSQIIEMLLDALLRILSADLVCARLQAPAAPAPVEILRVADWCRLSQPAIASFLADWPQPSPGNSSPPHAARLGAHLAFFHVPLGIHGEMGTIIAASERAGFPGQTESLLLSIAANQVSIALREAALHREQKRISDELDRRVAERTAELAATNEELRKEIVEHKLSEEALAKARSELARVTSITSLGVLTASIAHEVNQPLSGIVTNASTCLRMLSADPPNVDGARETARRTIRDGNRASDVITRLRTIYSKKDPSPESMDLNEAAREVMALSLTELQKSGVILRRELADDLPPVLGDRIQLQQVILNLLRNAADAMSTIDDHPRELLLRTERAGDEQVRLSVKDSGVGVTPQAADKIFAAFYTTKTGGMGIGLSISRSIIEAHHGRLWVTPNDGPGCTFSFAIPCALEGFAETETLVNQADPDAA